MKKRISMLVAVIMIMTSFMSVFNVNAAFSDVADDYKYKNAITTLSKLKIINGYDDGTFGPEKEITRAEFTKMVVYILGYDELSTKITQFNDVPESHWANANIKVAYDLGIVNGFDDVTFKPDSPVTYEQALKMMVCALGYQIDAERNGGYPVGYQNQANTLELTKGISGLAYTANAPRGAVAQIMYNALEVEMQEKQNNGYVKNGKNLLNDYLDVYIIKGTVVGVEESTTAECTQLLTKGQMSVKETGNNQQEYVLDYTEYSESFAEMNKLLGQTVQLYFRQDDASGDKWLVDIDIDTYKNEEVTILSKDFNTYDNNNLKCYVDGSSKTKTFRLENNDLTVRYNGRVVEGNVDINGTTYTVDEALGQWLTADSANIIYGNVKLIDTGSTGRYNIVDIYDYETIVAYAKPESIDFRIADKTVTGNYLILDPDSADYKYTIVKNNKQIETTDIAKDDVVNYAQSLDGELYTVYATDKTVKGTVTGINIDSSNNKTISIDNKTYNVTDRFLTYIRNKEQKELKTGVEITAHLDMFDAVEWGTIQTSSKYYPYAYVIDAAQEAEDYYLRMFAPTNTSITSFSSSTSYKVKSFKLATNVRLNGKKTSSENIISELRASAAGANPDEGMAGVTLTAYSQLVRAGFNSSGEVTDIVTISSTTGTKNEDTGLLVRYKEMDQNDAYTVTNTGVRDDSGAVLYSIRTSTPMFVIPKNRADSEKYSIKPAISSNTMVSGNEYYLESFDVSESRYPNLVLVYNTEFKSGTAITYTTSYRLLAENVEEEYDDNTGDIFSMLNVYNTSTSLTKINVSPDAAANFNTLQKGDIILNGLDSDKMADTYMRAISYADVKAKLDAKDYDWTDEQAQTADNNYQKYKFDFRFPKANAASDLDNYYETGGNVTDISSRASMFNFIQNVSDESMIYVSQTGFVNGEYDETSDYMPIKVSTSTKYVRYDAETEKFTPYAAGTERTPITVDDLKDAVNYGTNCSKIAVTYVSGNRNTSTATPTAKFIVIYE